MPCAAAPSPTKRQPAALAAATVASRQAWLVPEGRAWRGVPGRTAAVAVGRPRRRPGARRRSAAAPGRWSSGSTGAGEEMHDGGQQPDCPCDDAGSGERSEGRHHPGCLTGDPFGCRPDAGDGGRGGEPEGGGEAYPGDEVGRAGARSRSRTPPVTTSAASAGDGQWRSGPARLRYVPTISAPRARQ